MSKDAAPTVAPTAAPTTLHDLFATSAERAPDALALFWRGSNTVPASNYTYGELQSRIQCIAQHLAAAIRPGDRVAVLAWNCPAFLELIYSVSAAGGILVPLNARLAPAELNYQLQHSGAQLLFADAQLLSPLSSHHEFDAQINTIELGEHYEDWLGASAVTDLPTVDTNDPAWILFTSGSTGRPKGAVVSHQAFMAGLRSAALGRPVSANDRYLYPFPLFHVAAHNVLLQHHYGAAVVLLPSFDAASTLDACRELTVTTLSLAPTMIAMLLDHPDYCASDLSAVRTIGYGASAMPQTLLQRLLDDTDVGLCQSYGMTELAGSIAFLTVDDHKRAAIQAPHLLQSVGKPLPTAAVKVVDENGCVCPTGEAGEITVKARQTLSGYWNDSSATQKALQDGWLYTGDIGRFDEQGYLYIVDRKKDMIISGGENIASREVEEVIRSHPAVRDCAVIGQPDPQWGERLCAVVVLHTEIDDSALVLHCRDALAGFKTPKTWVRVDQLPLNAAGKIDKPRLRKELG